MSPTLKEEGDWPTACFPLPFGEGWSTSYPTAGSDRQLLWSCPTTQWDTCCTKWQSVPIKDVFNDLGVMRNAPKLRPCEKATVWAPRLRPGHKAACTAACSGHRGRLVGSALTVSLWHAFNLVIQQVTQLQLKEQCSPASRCNLSPNAVSLESTLPLVGAA